MEAKLVTLAEFRKLKPAAQGYISYMQAELPGSELKKHQDNPYEAGSKEYRDFERGQQIAVLDAQDGED